MLSIDKSLIKKFSDKYNKGKSNKLLKNALTHNPVEKVLINREIIKDRNNTFTKLVSEDIFITNQEKSGRCWLFSFLNLLRFKMIKKYKLEPEFQLSQIYLFFFDKLEKANYFLHIIYKNRKRDISGQLMKFWLAEPIGDGGYWQNAVNLIEKYGVVPKNNMHETYQSNNTKKLDYFLTTNLRRFALKIRKTNMTKEEFDIFLEEKLFTIYRLLVYFLGKPPTKFNWIYYSLENTKKKQKDIYNLTPLEFYHKFVPFEPNNYIPLFNFPIKKYPYYKNYKLVYCNNMYGIKDPLVLNVPMKEIREAVMNSLDDDMPVWFGADIDKYFEKNLGIANSDIYDYKHLDDPKVGEMDKGNKILAHQSHPSHAMLIVGYNKENNKLNRWLIENSWGPVNENNGFVNMATNWFNNYVYEVIVEKKFVSKKILNSLNSKKYEKILPWELFSCNAT